MGDWAKTSFGHFGKRALMLLKRDEGWELWPRAPNPLVSGP